MFQDRLRKIHNNVAKESQKRETQLKQQQSLNSMLAAQLQSISAQNTPATTSESTNQMPQQANSSGAVEAGEGNSPSVMNTAEPNTNNDVPVTDNPESKPKDKAEQEKHEENTSTPGD